MPGFEWVTSVLAFAAVVASVWAVTKAWKANSTANDLAAGANELHSQANDLQERLLSLEEDRASRERQYELNARAQQLAAAEASKIADFEFTLNADSVIIQNRGQGDAKKVVWYLVTTSGHDVTIRGEPDSRDLIRAGESWTYDIALGMGYGDVTFTIEWDDERLDRHVKGPLVLLIGKTVS